VQTDDGRGLPQRTLAGGRRDQLTTQRLAAWFGANHSISSSARPDSGSVTVMPSVLAVLRLISSSTFVACCTGRSAGLSPRAA
jgi:hypothetical protein